MFWALSPCELWLEFEIASLKRRDQFDRDTTLAWQVNRIYVRTQNDKRLPSLPSLLSKQTVPVSGRPSLAEQKAAFMEISKRYGIPVKEVQAA